MFGRIVVGAAALCAFTASCTSDPRVAKRSSAAASSASAEPARCALNRLAVTLQPTQGSAGHFGVVLEFENEGPTCTLQGYPEVDGILFDGTHIVSAERTEFGYLGGVKDGSLPTVVLSTGEAGSALVEGETGDVAGRGECLAYQTYLVTPPDAMEPVSLRSPYPLCYPEVHPVVNGDAGGQYAG